MGILNRQKISSTKDIINQTILSLSSSVFMTSTTSELELISSEHMDDADSGYQTTFSHMYIFEVVLYDFHVMAGKDRMRRPRQWNRLHMLLAGYHKRKKETITQSKIITSITHEARVAQATTAMP